MEQLYPVQEVTFTVLGKPQGKARPRFTKAGRVYTPRESLEYEDLIAAAYLAAGGKMLDGNIGVEVVSILPEPKDKKERHARKKPDVDNILKIVMDGLQGYAYANDAAVTHSCSDKYCGPEPKIIVTVTGRKTCTNASTAV